MSPTLRRLQRAMDTDHYDVFSDAFDRAEILRAHYRARRRPKFTGLGVIWRCRLGDDVTPDIRERKRHTATPILALSITGELTEYTDRWTNPDYDNGDQP